MPPEDNRPNCTCTACQKLLYRTPYRLKRNAQQFCSTACHDEYRRREPESRFWQNVQQTAQCWIWQGSVVGGGYGKIVVRGKPMMAHRFSYEMAHGPIPKGLIACHICDTPPCVRPDHLFLGTYADNSEDMRRKGRSCAGGRNPSIAQPEHLVRGESHHRARLTEAQVREILERRLQGEKLTEIALDYAISPSQVHNIASGRSWSHLTRARC